jgi:hypothetical protein
VNLLLAVAPAAELVLVNGRVRVLATLAGGEIVHRDPALRGPAPRAIR